MKFKKLHENVEFLPGANGNAYSSSRRLYEAIKVSKENIIASSRAINEAVDWEVAEDEKGGIVVLSTDVNAIELSPNRFINWVKQKVTTLNNRMSATKKIDKVAVENDLVGWTVGKFLDGRYKSKKGVTFGENSLSVEIVGIDTDKLIAIAEELCEAFMQEAVLVKDYSTGKIMFVNSNKETD